MINKYLSVLLSALCLSACSTIERRDYFSPKGTPYNTEELGRPSCGWKNFGGLPDTYKKADSEITIRANQSYEPYLIGPWFISVVPIFPFTWISEAVGSHELTVQVEVNFEGENARDSEDPNFTLTLGDNGAAILKPSSFTKSIKGMTCTYTVKFPINYKKLDRFVLHMRSRIKYADSINILYSRTHRWSWTQWSPNC